MGSHHTPSDIQATLAELTATTIAQSNIQRHKNATRFFISGVGIHNQKLVQRLSRKLSEIDIASTDKMGVDPDWVEAIAFAWLVKIHLERLAGNIPSGTGAKELVILGGVFPESVTKQSVTDADN